MTGRRISRACATGSAAFLRSLQERASAQVFNLGNGLLYAGNPFTGLLGYHCGAFLSHSKFVDNDCIVVNTNDIMRTTQELSPSAAHLALHTERLGPLPLVNSFIRRMGLEEILDSYVPTDDRRCTFSHAKALGVLLRSIIVEREPIYRQQETVTGFAAGLFGIPADQMERLSDDRIGRALDHLFGADRAAMLTEMVVTVAERFEVEFDQLHNDSTSISFCGQYRNANGRTLNGRSAPAIVHGFSKDHRPDLKQLLFILSVTADGIPASFRCADGNTNDSVTHIDTWNTLRSVTGRSDFLYVADSKLCSTENMRYIHSQGGRFVTVMPRSRKEDGLFREWMQSNTPDWQCVWDRPNCRYAQGPNDRWHVFQPEQPSSELWTITWVWSELLTLRQRARRQRNIVGAIQEFNTLHQRLLNARARLRGAKEIDERVQEILERHFVTRYIKVSRVIREEHEFKQTRRGRPGPDTAYRKVTHSRFDIQWVIDAALVNYDERTDGIYPLISNDRHLGPSATLEAHKGQPKIEKRFEQIKTVHEIAPVYLKNEGRIEALFTLYFLALLVQALIERELREAMKRAHIEVLPIYPEQRNCRHPTTEQVLRMFSLAQRNRLMNGQETIKCFDAELTPLQRQVLKLLSVPESEYRC
jgi:transposase